MADDELRDAECSMEQCDCARRLVTALPRFARVDRHELGVVGLPLVNRLQVSSKGLGSASGAREQHRAWPFRCISRLRGVVGPPQTS